MNVAMLGLLGESNLFTVKAIDEGKARSSKETVNGFGAVFSSLMEQSRGQVDLECGVTAPPTSQVPKEQILELLHFLQVADLALLENGPQLIDLVLSSNWMDVELLTSTALNGTETEASLSKEGIDLIRQMLNICPKNGLQLSGLKELFEVGILNTETDDSTSAPFLEKKWLKEEMESLTIAEIQQLAAMFISIPTEQLAQVLNQEIVTLLKANKLIELLKVYQDTYKNNEELKTLKRSAAEQQQFVEKLHALLVGGRRNTRSHYLQQRFSELKSDMKHVPMFPIHNHVGNDEKIFNQTLVDGMTKTGELTSQPFYFQQMAEAEQLTLTASNNGRPVTAEQLYKQFHALLSRSQFLKAGGTQKLFIKLHPEHLGAIRIELAQKNGTMVARILTSTAMARDMLDSQIHSLKQAFHSQQIQVERLEITQQFTQTERFISKDSDTPSQGEQQNEQGREQETQEDSFGETFEDALLNVEV